MATDASDSDMERTQVLVVGAGPVGLVMAHLLGAAGVETLLIEANDDTVPTPRATSLDGESLRTLQSAGLAGAVTPDLIEGFVSKYYSGDGTFLFATDLTARPFGFCMQNAFDQPRLERTLLDKLEHRSCVTARFSTRLLDLSQDEHGVTAHIQDPDGDVHHMRADYLIGCDGGRSEVRRGIGAIMEGDRLPQKWLVIDTVSTRDEHLPDCRFFCDPERPAMTLKRPHGERRWEWMLMPGETEADLLDLDRIRALLSEHVDPAGIEIYRKQIYGFSAVVADRFADRRVFLAGDAAHMTPPFAGLGLNSGIRDARNLAWKLAAVLQQRLPAALLDTYHGERHDPARALVDTAVSLGDRIQPTNPEDAADRDAFFAAINADPAKAAHYAATSAAGMREAVMDEGWFDADTGGWMPWQPELEGHADAQRLDDLLGAGFAALVCGDMAIPAEVLVHPLWRALAPTMVELGPLLPLGLGADALGPRINIAAPSILLLRPDRFVLTRLDGDGATDLQRLNTLATAVGLGVCRT